MNALSYGEIFRLIAPEIVVALTGLFTLILDIGLLRRASIPARLRGGILTACLGCALAMLLLLKLNAQGSLPGGMLVANGLTQLVQLALLVLAILVFLLCGSARFTAHVGEYLSIMLFATVAMMFLVRTQNLLVIFLTIEFLSLSLYILTGFDKRSARSSGAALKYFLFGGMSAGFLLFGLSLLYGVSGSIALLPIASAVNAAPNDSMLIVAMVMVVAGFSFKLAAAPFHMWAPEVYQGAPTSSAALIASSSKVASFFALFVVVYLGLMGAAGDMAWPGYTVGWAPLLAILAAVSMLWGNLAAIAQTSVRRLLAYSATAHAGYMLIALVAHTKQSLVALLYYVFTYALATLGAFGVLSVIEEHGRDRFSTFSGLGKRAPALSFCLLIYLLSLAGIPPLAGFFGKFYVFISAVSSSNHFSLLWLVILALLMSAISLYYYLKLLKHVYVSEPAAGADKIQTPLMTGVTLWLIAALLVVLGCAPSLLLSRIAPATSALFH